MSEREINDVVEIWTLVCALADLAGCIRQARLEFMVEEDFLGF